MSHLLRDQDNAAYLLFDSSAAAPDRAAVIDGATITTFGELSARAAKISAGLQAMGVAVGERVAVFLPRGAEAAAAFFGVLACGAINVTVNENLRPRQIEHILRHANAVVLLAAPELLARLPRPLQTDATIVPIADLPSGASRAPIARVGGDVAQIIYTSGSTGLPKGVTISHGNIWAGARSVIDYLGLGPADRIASLLPFSFDYGLNQLLCAAGVGATLVVERSPVPQRIVQTLAAAHVTVLPAVPPLWLQLLTVTAFRDAPLPALRLMTNTGGRLPVPAVAALRAAQPHAALVLMYGLTEAFRSSYLPPDKVDRKPASVGQPIPGAELLVLDDQLRPCAPGQLGQLVHRGPTVALGYWNDPDATARVFRPHPLRPPGTPETERVVFSGDLAYRDDEGDLFIVGREDAQIKTLGYRVSPDEVVDALYASGEIVEAVVVAEPDELRGSRIVAYVVLTPGGSLEALQRFASTELPRYLQPARIEVRSALSRTASGKHDARATAGITS